MTAKNQPTLNESLGQPTEEFKKKTETPQLPDPPAPPPPPQPETTKELAKNLPQMGDKGIELRNLDDLYRFGVFVVKAGLCPASIKTAEAVALVVQFGMEIGLTPMASLQNIYVINNKPSIYGPIGVGIAQATGKLEHYHEFFEGEEGTDNFKAVCELRRRGDTVLTRKEFSVGDAKRAGLWMVNTWAKYPKDMLMYKASWRALNTRFSDVLKGVTPREFEEEYINATKVEVIDPGKSKTELLADKLTK